MKTKAIIDHITNWLESYARNAGIEGFAVGISGGIDSAVTSFLCARTGMKVLCLDMPIHQSKAERSRAANHLERLRADFPNVEVGIHDLSSVFDAFIEGLPPDADPHELSSGNTRSRLRMTTLYYYAGSKNLLVVGTGNKVEDFGVGFFTKYGDGGVDLSPIADLMKTEVYVLGKELGVGRDILDAAPTDGLWADTRTDEDQLGATYPELEWAMEFSGQESELNERQKTVLQIYRKLHSQNLHKFKPIPVCDIPPELK